MKIPRRTLGQQGLDFMLRGRHVHWRGDRDDHGYYRNGAWVTF